jgi:hypothetical protein
MKLHSPGTLILVPILLMSVSFASAQEERHYTCYRTTEYITADGLLNEPDWSKAEWSEDFIDITGKPELRPSLNTRVKMLWDDENLYIAAELREPHIWATIRQRDEIIFHDNDFEVFLDPDGTGLNYEEIEINALGTVWDLMLSKAYQNGGKPLTEWDLHGMKTGIHIHGSLNDPSDTDTSWVVEMALPLSELVSGKSQLSSPSEGVQWRINFSRVEWKTEIHGETYRKIVAASTGKPLPEQNWVWSPMGEIAMHIPDRWGWLEFTSADITPGKIRFQSEKQKTDFRIWLWLGGHNSWKIDQWDSALSELRKAGIYGILTQAEPSTMKKMIPVAQKYGIVVEKWFVSLLNNDPQLIKEHPEWFVVSREGKSSVTDPAYVGYYRFLCPSHPEVIQHLKSSLDEYLKIPGLVGISLDYIRYPDVILPQALWRKYGIVQDREYAPYDYCYCSVCREKFKHQKGFDPGTMEHPEENADWRQFRYDEVTSVVSELSRYCHGKGKKISAAVFPGPAIAKQIVRQEWNRWPLDEVMPMLYQSFYYGSLDWIRIETAEGVSVLEKTVPLYSGLYIPSLTPRDLQLAINKSIEGGSSGICLFDYEAMTSRHWKAMKEILEK